ncbi:MAG: TatD family hydrolase [Gammaproteobacteria bacterium]|nr:TatD family hydrolase [Gammaproteobacteria bacterium]
MSNKLVDICVNLTDDVFAGKEKNIIDAANKNNVAKMVLVGNDLDSSLKVSSLAEQFSFVATAGYHPHNAKDWNEKSYDRLLSILKNNHVKAVGECGLDFNRNFSTPEIQNSVFLNHIDLAKETNLPLFVHERDAFHQMHSIIKDSIKDCDKIVVHCFTGTKNALIDYLDLGVHIGLTGWICDDRRGKHLRDFINIIPDDKLFIETDSPYLSPYISSKKPEVTSAMKHLNKPEYLVEVAKDVAKYRNQSYDYICEITYQNYLKFFGIDK